MGYGSRSDFTKTPQQDYDPGFVYDQEKLQSISGLQKAKKDKNDGAVHTFGNGFESYDKTMMFHQTGHWYGRGPPCKLGNTGKDLNLVKVKIQTFAGQHNDRGLSKGSL